MTKYTLKFRYAHEARYLYSTLSATTLEEAIEEAKRSIEYQESKGFQVKFKVSEAYIEKHIESKEIVWGLENGRNR